MLPARTLKIRLFLTKQVFAPIKRALSSFCPAPDFFICKVCLDEFHRSPIIVDNGHKIVIDGFIGAKNDIFSSNGPFKVVYLEGEVGKFFDKRMQRRRLGKAVPLDFEPPRIISGVHARLLTEHFAGPLFI